MELAPRIVVFENEKTWAKAVSTNAIDEFHKKFDQAVESVRKEFGKIAGKVFAFSLIKLTSPINFKTSETIL